MGRDLLGRSDTEATRERDGSDYKVLGESSVGKERDGSDRVGRKGNRGK